MTRLTRAGILFLMILQSSSLSYSNETSFIFDNLNFQTEAAAVLAAANIYNPVSIVEDREFMGAIIKRNDGFYFTVTAGVSGEDSVSISIPKPIWNDVVAFWHTHGSEAPHHRYFSEIDTRVVQELGRPFYLADYTGRLKVFRPGDATLSKLVAVSLGLPKQEGYARGTTVTDDGAKPVAVNI